MIREVRVWTFSISDPRLGCDGVKGHWGTDPWYWWRCEWWSKMGKVNLVKTSKIQRWFQNICSGLPYTCFIPRWWNSGGHLWSVGRPLGGWGGDLPHRIWNSSHSGEEFLGTSQNWWLERFTCICCIYHFACCRCPQNYFSSILSISGRIYNRASQHEQLDSFRYFWIKWICFPRPLKKNKVKLGCCWIVLDWRKCCTLFIE